VECLAEETEVIQENLPQMPLCPPQIPHDLTSGSNCEMKQMPLQTLFGIPIQRITGLFAGGKAAGT
jgi:hypothetical protein